MSTLPEQSALWGPQEPLAPPAATPVARAGSNDLDLFASVVKAATDPGYVVIGASERIFLRDATRPDHVNPVPRYEADTIGQMLDAGHLKVGGHHHVHHDKSEGPARSVLVPTATRAMGTRWAALRRVPAPRRPAPVEKRSDTPDRPRQVRVNVDVVRPGKGLVTCGAGDFSGAVVRAGRTYDVETEYGEVIGTARTYKAGAERLARHHGFPNVEVIVEIERDPW